MRCIAVTHIAFEDLGTFAAPLAARGYEIVHRHGGAAPLAQAEWIETDLVAVLGGPLGMDDAADYPWLRHEVDGLRARLDAGRPTLGICLGAQLMAAALGGGVSPRGAGKEIGWSPLTLADDGGALAPLAGLPVLHWHGDNIALPPGVAALASTPGTPVQAFAVGRHGLALQFHAEFDSAALEQWLAGHAVELRQAGVPLAALRSQTALHGARLAQAGKEVLARWLG
jgi:GMP synthase (glutamine-hydrolysing)